jgi:hypothetical protein
MDRSEIKKKILYLKKAWLLTKWVTEECVWNVNDLGFDQSNFIAQLTSKLFC